MTARSGFGEGVDEMIKYFRFPPRHGRDIFNLAIAKGTDIILENKEGSRFEERLPAWYLRLAVPQAILLYPIMIRNFPAGLLYGDICDKNRHLNRGLLAHIDKLRNRISRAIKEKRIGY
jgi:hypothetical protein